MRIESVAHRLSDCQPAAGSSLGADTKQLMTSNEAGGRRSFDPRLLCALACAMALSGTGAEAQIVPTGFQEYFVLGYEQHVWDMMSKVEAGEGGGAFANAMNSIVTAVASADNQIIYYDHWEDGLEADIFNPVQV